MHTTDDRAYYARRIESCLRLAREAKDPAIRNIHLRMAAEYRVRAAKAAEARPADDRVRAAAPSLAVQGGALRPLSGSC